MPPSLPPVRRVITTHTSQGLSTIASDALLVPANPIDPEGKPVPEDSIIPGFTNLYRTRGWPAKDVQGEWSDVYGKMIGLVDSSGVVGRIVDFPATGTQPDSVNITHRTQSIDIGVVLHGSITMVLDDGSETVFNQGDVCVQRGTDHAWRNRTQEPCRMFFVLIPSVPIKNEATGKNFTPTPTGHLEKEEHLQATR